MEARSAPGHFPIPMTLTRRRIPPGRTGPSRPHDKKIHKKKGKSGGGGKTNEPGGPQSTAAAQARPLPPGPGAAASPEGRTAAPDTRRLPAAPTQSQRGGGDGPGPRPSGEARLGPAAPVRTGPAKPALRLPGPARPRQPLTFFLAAASLLCLLPSAMSAPRPGHVSRGGERRRRPPGSAPARPALPPGRPGPW